MAFSVSNRVRVADQSSQFRGCKGEVVAVNSGSAYGVRLEGHPCGSQQRFLESQLKTDATAEAVSYDQCQS